MSRKEITDNAVAESFKSLKTELIYGNKLISKKWNWKSLNTLKFGTTEKGDILLWTMQLLKNLIIKITQKCSLTYTAGLICISK
jgi:hypothetical protein